MKPITEKLWVIQVSMEPRDTHTVAHPNPGLGKPLCFSQFLGNKFIQGTVIKSQV